MNEKEGTGSRIITKLLLRRSASHGMRSYYNGAKTSVIEW
jgi:hypothetical protein